MLCRQAMRRHLSVYCDAEAFWEYQGNLSGNTSVRDHIIQETEGHPDIDKKIIERKNTERFRCVQ